MMEISRHSVVAVYAVAIAERLGVPLDRLIAIRKSVEHDPDARLDERETACVEVARAFVEHGRLPTDGEIGRALQDVAQLITPLDTGTLQAP